MRPAPGAGSAGASLTLGPSFVIRISVNTRAISGGGGEAFGIDGELVVAVGGAEPPCVSVVVGAGVAGGFDGHATDRVGDHARQLAEGAVLEPQDAVGDFAQAVVVADDDDAAVVFGGEAAQQPADVASVSGVEVGGGFVGEQDGGVVGEGAGDGDALFLAAGELVGPEAEPVPEPDAAEEVDGAGAGGVTDGAGEVAGELDVLAEGR
jgi:hypothetical protein